MIRALLDTNVVLDALLARAPWDAEATALFEANRVNRFAAHMTASSVTDVFYVARRLVGRECAWLAVGACLDQLHVLSVGANELHAAASGTGDFEDNLQSACAVLARLDAIVTRDPRGFAGSPIPVMTPAELVTRLPQTAGLESRARPGSDVGEPSG